MIKKAYVEGIVWFFLAVFMGIKSIQMDLGTFSSPGPGFMPFIVALCLFSLASILLVQTTRTRKEQAMEKFGFRMSALYISCSIVAYVLLFKKMGYLLSTFLFMVFVFKSIGTEKWVWASGAALLVTLLSYLVFGMILQLNLPAGIF